MNVALNDSKWFNSSLSGIHREFLDLHARAIANESLHQDPSPAVDGDVWDLSKRLSPENFCSFIITFFLKPWEFR